MTNSVQKVWVHSTVFPNAISADLERGFKDRNIPAKFLYDSPGKTTAWLRLHQRYSPASFDDATKRLYTDSARWIAQRFKKGSFNWISLCPGSGTKEELVLDALPKEHSINLDLVEYSLPLLLKSAERLSLLKQVNIRSLFLADLLGFQRSDRPDLPISSSEPVLFSFFGTLHAFAPEKIFPHLRELISPGQFLLAGINGASPQSSINKWEDIRLQYSNQLTYAWLHHFFSETGFPTADLNWSTSLYHPEDSTKSPTRIAIEVAIENDLEFRLWDNGFEFKHGEKITLFQSYRYHLLALNHLFQASGFSILESATSENKTEIILLLRREKF